MTDRKLLYLMALKPRPSYRATFYTLDMPASLHDAIIDLLDPRRSKQNIQTFGLKTQLLQLLDQPVQIKSISRKPNALIDNWIIANRPIDSTVLLTALSNWVHDVCPKERRDGEAYRRALDEVNACVLRTGMVKRPFKLFDENGKPAHEITFPGFALTVCDAIVGKTCHLSCGIDLRFGRIYGGTGRSYELLSQIFWYKEQPFALALELSVQTVPHMREARLNAHVHVRRFAHGMWERKDGELPYLHANANALVRKGSGPWHRATYQRVPHTKTPEWNSLDKQNLKKLFGIELPDIEAYLRNMSAWAKPGAPLQILTPWATTATWQEDSKVEPGVTINDKAEIFEFVASCLADAAIPCQPICIDKFTNYGKLLDDKKKFDDPEKAAAHKCAQQRSNRKRLAAATECRHVVFELWGTCADKDDLATVKTAIESMLGRAGTYDDVEIEIKMRLEDGLLDALDGRTPADAAKRMGEIHGAIPRAAESTPVACIVILPRYGHKRDAEDPDPDLDPKQAIRMGLAQTGRLSQFLTPRQQVLKKGEQDTFDIRCRAAVCDLLRQLGFTYEPKDSEALKPAAPLYGVHLYSKHEKYARNPAIVSVVEMALSAGTARVLCPQLGPTWMPYWKALLKLAQSSMCKDIVNARGDQLKMLIDRIAAEAPEGSLLLVHSYGDIRRSEWWPGIADARIDEGPLRYGPTINARSGERQTDIEFNCKRSNLNIMRVRLGANGEVPDYYTDLCPADDADTARNAQRPKRRTRQGICQLDGFFLTLAPRGGDTQYKRAQIGSKFDYPGSLCHTKTLNEYRLLTSDDPELAKSCMLRAEASREIMVQLTKQGKVNLPTPLHLAQLMDEYIWRNKR